MTLWTVCSLPGSPVHGIVQARILEWVAVLFSRGSSPPRDQTQVAHIAGGFFTVWATREAPNLRRFYKQRERGITSVSTQGSQAEGRTRTWPCWPPDLGLPAPTMRNKCLLFKPPVCRICYGHCSQLSLLCRDFGFYSELGALGGFEFELHVLTYG